MKSLMLVLAMILGATANAVTNERVEDLDTEAEAEQLEVFDQRQMEETAQKEAQAIARQAQELEAQISRLKSESKNISSRLDRQGVDFKRIYKLAAEAQRKVKTMELQRNQLRARSEALQARISQEQSRLTSAQEFQRSLGNEIRQKTAEQRDLKTRLQAAETRIQRAQNAIKRMRKQNRRLSDANEQLKNRVASRARRAEQLEERSLERDL